MLKQMQNVTSGLQQYMWLSDTLYTSTDLNETALQAIEKLQLENPEVQISIQKDDLPVINADSKQMQLLFYQLLSNAVKFRKRKIMPVLK
jgi:two-component system CheB/CheR fusion protein